MKQQFLQGITKGAKLLLIPHLLLSLLCSCRESEADRRLTASIEQTWQLCETSLQDAGLRAERLRDSVENASEHVRQRYDLLLLRLRDKNNIVPSSPDSALQVASYFSRHGEDRDGERALYYLGSTYRDLKDYPQAVSCFLKAVDIARQSEAGDTAIWLNALSQLTHLYMQQLGYEEELKTALKAAELAREVKLDMGFHLAEAASAYRHMNDTLHCLLLLDETYRIIQDEHFHPKYGGVLAYMLQAYSDFRHREMCDTLLRQLMLIPEAQRPQNYDLCVAKSFEEANSTDSAILHYAAYYNKARSIAGRYEASAGLQRCHLRRGDFRQAALWGCRLYETNDSIIAERAFEETQRARDTYIYYRDREAEQAIIQRDRLIVTTSVIVVLMLLCLLLGAIILYNHRKRKFAEVIDSKERLLHHAEEEIKEQSAELMQREKTNRKLVQIALLDNATDSADSVIEYFCRVAAGKEKMREEAWKELMSTIEVLYPGFLSAVQARLKGQLREPLLRTICLTKIGLRPMQIANIMDEKKQTVWNRVKRAQDTCGDLLYEIQPAIK